MLRIYLKKLWTVFELTTFLAMKPEGQLVVQPVILGPVAVYFVIIQCLRIPEMFLVPVAHERLLSLELLPALGAYSILELSGGSWKICALKFFMFLRPHPICGKSREI